MRTISHIKTKTTISHKEFILNSKMTIKIDQVHDENLKNQIYAALRVPLWKITTKKKMFFTQKIVSSFNNLHKYLGIIGTI